MIEFTRVVLPNKLRVLVHEDTSTPMAAINVLYDVGSRDEQAERTGFAHLFEHLMFSGSETVPDFDDPVQRAGGENNAFTNADMTNFHITVPAQNLEVGLWLEADRMRALKVNAKNLSTQRKVVIEEFKETCLNEPYGDIWHHLSSLIYQAHPYRWPVIGLVPEHVEQATLDEVRDFYQKHYVPSNAILTICGNVHTPDVLALVEKWFGGIPSGQPPPRNLPAEPTQTHERRKEVWADVPVDALFMAYVTPHRKDPMFYAADLLSDILSYGPSSRLYSRLVKEKQLLSSVDAYVSANIDPGILLIEARPADGVSLEQAEAAIRAELQLLITTPVSDREFGKLINKVESNFAFSEGGALNKAINLGFFELLDHPELINTEMAYYHALSPAILCAQAKDLFKDSKANVLYYRSKKE